MTRFYRFEAFDRANQQHVMVVGPDHIWVERYTPLQGRQDFTLYWYFGEHADALTGRLRALYAEGNEVWLMLNAINGMSTQHARLADHPADGAWTAVHS